MSTKTCRICSRELPKTDEYFSHHIKPSGTKVFDSCCKPCAAAKKRQKRKENPEHEREIDRVRHQRDHNKRVTAMKNYADEHREAIRLQNKRNYQERGIQYNTTRRLKNALNPEPRRAYARLQRRIKPEKYSYYDRNKRSKRHAAEGHHTLQDEINQREKQRNRCYWCGCMLEGKGQVDHVIPLARGGTDWLNNIVIACPHCNNTKNAKLPFVEWQPPNPLKD